jgi:uncharacterized protein
MEETLLYIDEFAPAPTPPESPDVARLLAMYGSYADTVTGPIGRVVASEREPSGAHEFFFWASDNARSLDVGHIVVSFSEEAVVIGVVDEPRRFSDLRSFLDDYFDRHVEDELAGEHPTRRPEILVFAVRTLATCHLRKDVDSHRPPVGGPVFFATAEAIEYATGREEFSGRAIPALLHTNGNVVRDASGEALLDGDGNPIFQRSPLWLDEDYLLGPEAGHANWTGQSGLATKTSHVLFLLSAIFQKLPQPDQRGETKKVAALLFNVKGPDLLWLDKPAVPEPGLEAAFDQAGARRLRDIDFDAYRAMGIDPKPFEHVRIFAPFKPSAAPSAERGHAVVHLASEKNVAGKLNTLRNKPGQTANIVHPILWDIRQLLGMPHKLFDAADIDDKFFGLIYELRDSVKVTSIADILAWLDHALAELNAEDGKSEYMGHHKATLNKARNRFQGLTRKYGGLLTDGQVDQGGLPQVDAPFTNQEVRVVDIAHCNTNVQEVLVASIVNEVWRLAEDDKLGVDKVVIFVDELNKYAASGSQSALRDTLVDIAARGRHLNLVLFGAQQFRSKVDDEILGNCGTSFYGRVGDEEITNASYRSLSDNTRTELLGLRKGRILARHAHYRAPLFGAFPLPPCIAGSSGQRIFNPEAAANSEPPGVGLFRLIDRLDKSQPSMAMVVNLCQGLDYEAVDRICGEVEIEWSRRRNQGNLTAWLLAERKIKVMTQSTPPF